MTDTQKKLTLCCVSAVAALAILALTIPLPAQFMLWAILAITLMTPAGEECSLLSGLGLWLATSVTALALPMLESAMLFALFGFYPIMRPRIEALQMRSLRSGMRLLITVCSSAALFLLLSYFFGDLLQELTGGTNGPLLLLLLALTAVYLLLVDFFSKHCAALWRNQLRSRFFSD